MYNMSEQEIMKNWKGDPDKPIVSISNITYNHENYIAEALDSFLMQETSFPFEILTHDDASTDKTTEIIREYEEKYPNIIKPICQKENKYSKGIKINSTFNFPRAKGNYIALCEGDDYWTDPLKLQKQVEFMETHKDVSLVFQNAKHHHYDNDGNVCKKELFNDSLGVRLYRMMSYVSDPGNVSKRIKMYFDRIMKRK